MKNILKNIRSVFQDSSDTRRIKKNVTRQVIDNAYLRRKKEIESLRLYDRGEKKINAPDIRNLVRSL